MSDPGAPLRLGIIGLGVIGAEMLAAAMQSPDFVVAAAADLDDAALRRTRDQYPALKLTSDPFAVTSSPEIDAVYVATPPAAHAGLVTAALLTDKAVFCEKPLAVDLGEGRRLADLAASLPGVAAVNFALSDRHAVLRIEDALHHGEIGDVRGVDVRLAFRQWPREFQSSAQWVAGRAQGGLVREVFSHFAYLTDRLLGPLDVVLAELDADPDGRSAEVSARGFFRAGDIPVQLSAFSGVAGPETYEWTLHGTRASYSLRNWSELFRGDSTGWLWTPLSGPRGSEATRLALFARAVRGQHSHNLADFAAAFRVQQVVEAFRHAT